MKIEKEGGRAPVAQWALLVGRVLFGGFFLLSGINHFTRLAMTSQYAASKGVPMATLLVAITGALLLFGGLSILIGFMPKLGVVALVVFLVPVTLMMHNFWTISDPGMRMTEMGNFMKNVALCGGALCLAAVPEPWRFSVSEMSRSRVERPRTPVQT